MVEKETIAVSRFKATCLQVLRRVKRTGRPVVITRFGEPLAEIVPPVADGAREGWLGVAEGALRLHDDLIEPASPADDWEAVRD